MIEKLPQYHDSQPLHPAELEETGTKSKNPPAAITRIEARLEHVLETLNTSVKSYVLISLTPSTSFANFQRMLQQHWLRSWEPRLGATWSTWLHIDGSPKAFIGETNWTEARQQLLDLAKSRSLAWDNGEAELITTFMDLRRQDTWRAKDIRESRAMMVVHESMERELVMQGRYLTPPQKDWSTTSCCVM